MKPPESKNAEKPVSFTQTLGKNQRSSTTALCGIPSSSAPISQNPNIAKIKLH
jgi:hypothetical protein